MIEAERGSHDPTTARAESVDNLAPGTAGSVGAVLRGGPRIYVLADHIKGPAGGDTWKEADLHVLDCETFETTLASVATAANVSEQRLFDGLARFDPATVDSSADWYEAVPRAALASVGINIDSIRFEAICAFHGTRTLDPRGFLRQGILPLGAMIDRLWDDLFSIAGRHVTTAEWHAIRASIETGRHHTGLAEQSAFLYQLKVGRASLHGPYANLVRDHVIAPVEGHHDYLTVPEIVQDIARFTGTDLQDRFERAAQSCVVKFRHDDVTHHEIASAVSYLMSKAHNEPHGFSSVHGIDCKGVAAAPQAVIAVDEIDLSRRTELAHATTSRLLRDSTVDVD